jgi:purine-nucleoside phosphorylase
VHAAKHSGAKLHVGSVATSDTFYDPDTGRHQRWRDRGVLAVEMEAAVLFTIGALRGMSAGCMLCVSDLVIGEFVRISDEELRNAVDRMTELAIRTALA